MTAVVLTGATRGIGRAAAIELARRGAEVVLVGRDPESVRLVAKELQMTPTKRAATPITIDARTPDRKRRERREFQQRLQC